MQANPHILFAFVHGSFLENDLPFADIDIAIYLDGNGLDENGLNENGLNENGLNENGIICDVIDLCLDLSLQLSALVGKKVDIHALNRCKLGFCYEATRGELLFTKDEDACFDFIEKTRLQYFDYKHLFEENLKDLIDVS